MDAQLLLPVLLKRFSIFSVNNCLMVGVLKVTVLFQEHGAAKWHISHFLKVFICQTCIKFTLLTWT